MYLLPHTKHSTLIMILLLAVVIGSGFGVRHLIESKELKRTERGIASHFVRFQAFEAPKRLPPISFAGPDGDEAALKDFRGQIVVLNVWATWCRPCITELPSLQNLQKLVKGQGVKVIAVSIDLRKDIEKVSAFLDKYEISDVARYHDINGQVQDTLNPRALPATYILDKRGRMIYEIAGEAAWDSPRIIDFLQKLAGR